MKNKSTTNHPDESDVPKGHVERNGLDKKEKRDIGLNIKYSFKASVPVMAGYIVLGMGFGILLQDAGYSWLWALLMSFAIYAGSMQYVTVNLLTAGASLIATALMTLMVNIRHLFYGITMIEKYKDTGASKPYLIFALTDETFSLVCSPDLPQGVDRKLYYLFVSALNQFYWIVGSIAGALIGSALTFNTAGIDFSMTALFTVIFAEQWEKAGSHIPAICGVVISVICLVVFGVSNFLIPSMIGITAAMFTGRRFLEGRMEAADPAAENAPEADAERIKNASKACAPGAPESVKGGAAHVS